MYNGHLLFAIILLIPQARIPTSPRPTPIHLLPQVLLKGVKFEVTEDSFEVGHVLVLGEVEGEFEGGEDGELVVYYLLCVG